MFLITLEIRCLSVRSYYVRKYDIITLRVGSSFLDYFFVVHLHNILKKHYSYVCLSFCHCGVFLLRHHYVIYLFKMFCFLFSIKSDISSFFVRSNYVWKLRYNYALRWFVNLHTMTYFS